MHSIVLVNQVKSKIPFWQEEKINTVEDKLSKTIGNVIGNYSIDIDENGSLEQIAVTDKLRGYGVGIDLDPVGLEKIINNNDNVHFNDKLEQIQAQQILDLGFTTRFITCENKDNYSKLILKSDDNLDRVNSDCKTN